MQHPEIITLNATFLRIQADSPFSNCRTYSASKYPPIGFAALWGILHDRKYTHSPANGIRYAAIRCFTKEPRRGDNYFTFFLSLPYRTENRRFSALSCTKTGSTQPKLSAACFVVQSCLADADFVVFSDYCLIGTRHSRKIFIKGIDHGYYKGYTTFQTENL